MTKSPSSRHFRSPVFPDTYSRAIAASLAKLGYDLHTPKRVADAVLKLSDFYIANPEKTTPWSETWAQVASLAYYFPLNYARNSQVATEAARLGFFSGLKAGVDFGSGTGSALFAFADRWNEDFQSLAIDRSPVALQLASELSPGSSLKNYVKHVQNSEAPPESLDRFDRHQSLLMASYVYTELERVPDWWLGFEALAIVEPSTQADGRRLLELRTELLEAGYQIWAPCTHAGSCPLLTQSERDWCHDRIHWQAPDWFEKIERHLPMKNRTLTYSYLLARRSRRPPSELESLARLTGDMLEEKGKTRQSVCRGSEREFLAWFPKRWSKGESLQLERGNLVRFKEEMEKKSSELRLSGENSVEEIPPQTSV